MDIFINWIDLFEVYCKCIIGFFIGVDFFYWVIFKKKGYLFIRGYRGVGYVVEVLREM